MKLLPIVNVFEKSYEFWEYRDATQEERLKNYQEYGFFNMHVPDNLVRIISNAYDALST
ncbi:hypothetical protein [Actinobacillus arthritidis]|uniref:hypothetical protein n=1 Tax=Actinobacillus arthritidis TaxID=157339 RepID=UPI0024414A0A|nr:hypothetical protein [Actinobacillus arthritidis]WGE89860.1 hypothetical protein NYR89_02880 [Actinobacillus arthritidis]